VRFHLRGYIPEVRSHHFAGSAPGCPEINHQGDVIAAQMFLEALIGQLDGLANK
jgi:hypothetical protein